MDLLEFTGVLEGCERFVRAVDKRIAFLEEQTEFLATGCCLELTDNFAVIEFGGRYVVGGGEIDNDSVNLSVLQCTLSVISVVENIGLIRRLNNLGNKGKAGGSHLSTQLCVFEFRDSGCTGDR